MSYQDIGGWCDFEDIYARRAREANPGAVFVEVGCFLGRSLAYLLEQLGDKPATVYAVDPWIDDPFESFCYHMRTYSALERVKVVRVPSPRAARLFDPASVDYVFLDGDHNLGAIRSDIAAWRQVVKPGGWLGGHDHQPDYPGVLKAVEEAFGPGCHASQSSWEVRL